MRIDLLAQAAYLGGFLPNEPENLWRMAGAASRAAFDKSRAKVMRDFVLDEERNAWANPCLAGRWQEADTKSSPKFGKAGAQAGRGKKADGQATDEPEFIPLPGYRPSESGSRYTKDRDTAVSEVSQHDSESCRAEVVPAPREEEDNCPPEFCRPTPPDDPESCVHYVWRYYRETFDPHSWQYDLTYARMKVCHERLRECLKRTNGNIPKVAELMMFAIDRLAESKFHNGGNSRQEMYVDWERDLFGTAEIFERWLTNAPQ
jgi:hypothetical protein